LTLTYQICYKRQRTVPSPCSPYRRLRPQRSYAKPFPAGAGYDQIDVPVCTAHNIRVSNVPTAVDDATADTAVFLTLGALRGFNLPLINLRKGLFRGETPPPLGHDPQGKVLGILGMGGIGRNMAKKLRAFGMSVQYYNRNKLSEDLEDGAKYVEFEELLKTSDVISLNLPLNVR